MIHATRVSQSAPLCDVRREDARHFFGPYVKRKGGSESEREMRHQQRQVLVCTVLVAVIAITNHKVVRNTAIGCLVFCLALMLLNRKYNHFCAHLIAVDGVNEALVMEGELAGESMLFMIDTGYAGPPVLSSSYLAICDQCRGSVERRYRRAVELLEAGVSEDAQNGAIDAFLNRSGCLAYTSGCTMRLMSIGATHEQQADMFMCNMLKLMTTYGAHATPKRASSDAHADVFVTNPLPTSVHILTCDFLVHSSPALISPSRQLLNLNLSAAEDAFERVRMTMHPLAMSGGSFVVELRLGGEQFRCTVDTGAPGPVCLSAAASARLRACDRDARDTRVLRQAGVNGEEVCSELVGASMEFGGASFENVPVFVNDSDTEQVDGYIGMGVLRAFDILVSTSGIGFARGTLPMRTLHEYRTAAFQGTCDGVRLACGR